MKNLRDEIAYEIYKKGRASNAMMPFEVFCKDDKSSFIIELKETANAILNLPEIRGVLIQEVIVTETSPKRAYHKQ